MSFTEMISHLTKEAAKEINFESYGMVQMSTEPSDVSCRSSKLYFRQAATHVRARSPHVCESL